MATVQDRVTGPRPRFRPPRLWPTAIQSAIEAPRGRVMTYAVQKAVTAFRLPQRWATAGTAIAVQENHGTYRRAVNCTARAATRAMPPRPTAGIGPSQWARKSEAVSPIPVVSTLMIQK